MNEKATVVMNEHLSSMPISLIIIMFIMLNEVINILDPEILTTHLA